MKICNVLLGMVIVVFGNFQPAVYAVSSKKGRSNNSVEGQKRQSRKKTMEEIKNQRMKDALQKAQKSTAVDQELLKKVIALQEENMQWERKHKQQEQQLYLIAGVHSFVELLADNDDYLKKLEKFLQAKIELHKWDTDNFEKAKTKAQSMKK